MRRATLPMLVFVLGLAAPAAAWVEQPPYAIRGGGMADCLRAAGPGQVALLGALGPTTSATDLLRIAPGAVTHASTTTLGWLDQCPEVATAEGAQPLLAGVVSVGRRSGKAVGVADVGGAPTILGRDTGADFLTPSVATAAGGASVVAWGDIRYPRGDRPPSARVLAALRPSAGAPFGPVRVLDAHASPFATPVAGIDAGGRATVAWSDDVGTRRRRTSLVRIASAPPGRPFAAAQRLTAGDDQAPALAVATNGRALVVVQGVGALAAFERQPGAARFARVPLPIANGIAGPAVALNGDGGAAIAYRTAPRSASALLRSPGHGFTRSGPAAPVGGSSTSVTFYSTTASAPIPPTDPQGAALAVALSPGGALAIAWGGEASRRSGEPAYAVHGTLASGLGPRSRLGSPCRAVNAVRPLTLASGALGVAWTDNTHVASLFGDDPRLQGRLHLALPGRAPAPAAPAPRLVARLLPPSMHGRIRRLRINVRCGHTACDVRASTTARLRYRARGGESTHVFPFPFPLTAARALAAGRRAVLRLRVPSVSDDTRVALARTVTVSACTPDGAAVRRVVLKLGARDRVPR